jgi:Xaa-Pro aminopeptidase
MIRPIKPTKAGAYLITGKSNIKYLCGFTGSNGFLLVTRKKTILFTDSRYIERAKYTVPRSIELVDITRVWRNPEELKKEWQKKLRSLRVKTIGVEESNLTVTQYKKYKKISPKIKFVDISGEVEKLRAIKTPREIELITKSQRINEKVFGLIKKLVHKRKSKPLREIDIVWEIKRLGSEFGAEDVSFDPIVAFGKNSSMPHHQSGTTRLKKGDLVLIDMGMKYKEYCSDMTRIIFTAPPTKLQKEIYNTVLKAQETVLENVRNGFVEQKIDSLARDTIKEAGYGETFGHGTGHGVGLDIHESPSLSDKGKNKIKPGMVITVEPGIYLPGKFGIRIEDMAMVTKSGLKNLTRLNKDLDFSYTPPRISKEK